MADPAATQPAIDTQQFVEDLERAGLPPGQARGTARALNTALATHLPTKTDFAELKADFAGLKADFAGLRADFAVLRAHVDTQVTELRAETVEAKAELKADIAVLDKRIDTTRVELKADIAQLRADVQGEFKTLYKHLWLMAAGIVALNVTLTVTLTRALS